MPAPDNTDAEIEQFDAVCTRLAGFDERIDTEWADAYLTAVHAGPQRVEIDEWLPRLARGNFERAFADPDDEAWARSALLARSRVLVRQLDPEALLDAPDELRLQPLVTAWTDEMRQEFAAADEGAADDEVDLAQTGAVWATGFADALADFADLWSVDAVTDAEEITAFDEMLQQVRVLALRPGSAELLAHVERFHPKGLPTREDLIDEACFAVQDLRVWWLDHAPRPQTRQVPQQPGRNDPCPCGSGLKFKKCHGRG